VSVALGDPRLGSDSVVLLPADRARGAATRQPASISERPAVRLAAFAALALYGTIRWATLLSPAPIWRLLGMWAVATALACAGWVIRSHRRVTITLLAIVAAIVVLPLAGIPVRWVTHERIAVSASAIGDGLSALPRALVPYNGINDALRMVIVLGAGVLLLDGGLMLAFAPRPLGDLRRAAAALPLVALAIVPATLVRPDLPYLQGVILFLLTAAFMWGERLRSGEVATASVLALLAGAAGMIAAPRIDPRSPWVDYQALAGNLAPSHPESFDWSQRYGPLHWPRGNREVLDVQAQHPDYWKAQNLDVFDGRGWVNDSVQASYPQDEIAQSSLARWTQTIHVTLRAMRTTQVIGAGTAAPPEHFGGNVIAGASQGTWTTPTGLAPGDSYTITTYDPHPSAAQLRAAGTDYPGPILEAYLTVYVPADPRAAQAGAARASSTRRPAPVGVLLPAFDQTMLETYGSSALDTRGALAHSPYAQAYSLARRLTLRSATPYDYALSVEHYLQQGFRYDENPPASAYPLETFLFKSKVGYCQQFAGAMALLLRLGGVPARVAAGFTTGDYNATTHQWVVSDLDAHAWVEAWFPGYGWVRFDPTPAAAPARGGHIPLPAIKGTPAGSSASSQGSQGLGGNVTPAQSSATHHGGGSPVPLILGLVALVLVIAILARATVRLHEPDIDQLLGELERALRRCGRPIGPGTTLAGLEQRFHSSGPACGYIRTLRLSRFAGGSELPNAAQRRALRAQLRAGLGPMGFVRALWAIPPRVRAYRAVSSAPARGIHSN
jgi:transglutaminase-like putative cysteine protease